MNRFPRLLCLAALASTAAFAQTTLTSSLVSDPSLASDAPPALTQPDAGRVGTARPGALKPSAAQRSSQSQAQSAQINTPQPEAVQLEAAVVPAAAPASLPDAQPNSQPNSQPRLQPRSNSVENLLPTATVLRLKLVRPISTASARPGEQFFATLTRPVDVEGRTVIPAGTSVTCRVDSAHSARRFAGKPSLSIKALSAHIPSGETLNFTASVIDTNTPRRLDVDQEGRVRGVTYNPMDKVEMGSLAGVGLIAGAVIAGPEGLLIGTAGGAAIAAGHIVVKHRDLTLPAGTELIFELDTPATTQAQLSGAE
jgi:hypothetical protein